MTGLTLLALFNYACGVAFVAILSAIAACLWALAVHSIKEALKE